MDPKETTPETTPEAAPAAAPVAAPVAPVDTPAKGYGKRPLWQWVLLYVVVAIVVYGAVYLIFFSHGTAGSTGTPGY